MSSRVSFEPPLDPAAYAFRTDVRVRFAETDAMGIVHHASYLPYLEAARVEWLRAIGHDYVGLQDSGVQFPVVEVAVRYLKPSVFDDVLTIHLTVATVSRATLQIGYLLTANGDARVSAVTVHSCSDRAGRVRRLPEWVLTLAG